MSWDSAFVWLVQSAFVTSLVLAIAAGALTIFRQPADRSRLIQWALAAAALCLPLAALSPFALLSLDLLERAPASAAVVALLHEIAGPGAEHVRLLTTDALPGPVTFGIRAPVILLPEVALAHSDASLRYYLAHEWAHVSRRDARTWQFASALQILFYYQPLYWYLRSRLSVALDQLADSDAATQGETHADYASFLVGLARKRQALPRLSLGIGGRGTSLRQRVVMLLAAVRPRPTCSRSLNRVLGAVAIGAALFVSTLRLDAEPAATEPAASPAPATQTAATPPAAEAPKTLPEAITYDCTVVDAVTDKPIPDVKVTVWRRDSSDWSDLEVTEHTTDAEGRYRFTLSPEQVARSHLYLEVAAKHPDYAMKGRSGYSHDMIRKNLELGQPPFYSKIRLWPGEAITGTLVDPEGQPIAGAEVSLMALSNKAQRFDFSRGRTKTDEQGQFRVVPPTPGSGALWIRPERFTPLAFLVGERRGDWGQITAAKGTDVQGKLLDQDGAPVGGVRVEARRKGDGPELDKWLNENSVANNIGRRTVAAADGSFTLAALPDGDYTITIEADSDSYDPPPLAQVFLRRNFTINGGVAPAPLEIRAVPHVTIKARYFDSAGKPRSGHDQTLFGRDDGQGNFFATESNSPGKDGWLEILAPRGLTGAEIDLSTNEHSALRWRLGHDAPLRRSRRVPLGTLDRDIDNLEIIRYVAPILLVKPVDESGAVLEGGKVTLTYKNQDPQDELIRYTSGGNVNMEKQRDGRWQSSQLLPDEPFTVEVEKPGYETAQQELSLVEGEEREVTMVLKPQPAAEAPAENGPK